MRHTSVAQDMLVSDKSTICLYCESRWHRGKCITVLDSRVSIVKDFLYARQQNQALAKQAFGFERAYMKQKQKPRSGEFAKQTVFVNANMKKQKPRSGGFAKQTVFVNENMKKQKPRSGGVAKQTVFVNAKRKGPFCECKRKSQNCERKHEMAAF